MSHRQAQSDSLPESAHFLRLLPSANSITDLEQWLLSAHALEVYISSSNHSRLQKLVADTDVFALLCVSLSTSLQLLVAAAPGGTAATGAVRGTALSVLAALSSSAHKLLVHAKNDSGDAGNRCTDGMVASINASGKLDSQLYCKANVKHATRCCTQMHSV
jgi:hypothetical protein